MSRHMRNRKLGKAFEYRVMRSLKHGKHRILSAGSHGLWDIMATTNDNRIRYISCKRNGYIDPKERQEMLEFFRTQAPHMVMQVAYAVSPKKWRMKTILREEQINWFSEFRGLQDKETTK